MIYPVSNDSIKLITFKHLFFKKDSFCINTLLLTNLPPINAYPPKGLQMEYCSGLELRLAACYPDFQNYDF